MNIHFLTLILIAPFVMVGCGKDDPVVAAKVRPVIVQTVLEPSGQDTRTFTGVLKSADSTSLGFEVSGRITQIIAKEGRSYVKGEMLARLDVANLESELRRAEAGEVQAVEELKRIQQLYETENASKADLDNAIAAQSIATASAEVARKSVKDGTLLMPYDGVIESVKVDEQNVVSAGTEVMSIRGNGAMKAHVGVPADLIGKVKLGMKGKVFVNSLTEDGLSATVERIYPQVTSNGTYDISLLLEETTEGFLGGMNAEAELKFQDKEAETIRIDAAAVSGGADGENYVWIVKEGSITTVTKRNVTIGNIRENGEIDILSGLKPGEKVVTRGVNLITEGMVVTLSPAA